MSTDAARGKFTALVAPRWGDDARRSARSIVRSLESFDDMARRSTAFANELCAGQRPMTDINPRAARASRSIDGRSRAVRALRQRVLAATSTSVAAIPKRSSRRSPTPAGSRR